MGDELIAYLKKKIEIQLVTNDEKYEERIPKTPIWSNVYLESTEMMQTIVVSDFEIDQEARRQGWCTAFIEALENVSIESGIRAEFRDLISPTLMRILRARGWTAVFVHVRPDSVHNAEYPNGNPNCQVTLAFPSLQGTQYEIMNAIVVPIIEMFRHVERY